ncbi:MAG: pectate lyase [Prevotella sp.]|nr:pectate lyase [Prevotella sp.]
MKKIFTLIAMLVMTLTASAAFQITEAKGWQESLYAKFSLYDGAETYNVYVKGGQYADYTQIDKQLVRDYGTYGRADVVGLKAGNYSIKVVPVVGGAEVTASAAEQTGLTVKNYTREGFAFMNSYSPGAYKSDGTLKANAKVFYVTKNTAKTISMNVSGAETNPCVGLQAIITGYEKGQETTPVAFRFIGLVEVDDLDAVGSKEEGIQIKGKKADSELNMTFEGIGDDATIRGFGFLLRNTKGVEFRNFGIMRCMDDGISMDTDNSNIWVHNMDIFYGKHGSGDHAKGDGALDVKSDSKYVTVSYNRFWDTGKSNMFGMKSESGPNYISYDHNWFDHSDSRHPRVRTMSVHVWNNYFDNVAKYGVGATTSASVFVESNYFLKTKKPILSSQQGTDGLGDGTFSGENGGIIKAYGNYFDKTATNFSYYTQNNPASTGYDAYEVTSRDAPVPPSETARVGGGTYNNFDTNSSLMYTYNPVAAADVPALVMGEYGAGRLNHGDFTYSFPDNVGNDNTDSAYDATLGSKLDDYKSSFVKIFGDADSGEGGGDDPTPTPTDNASFCHFTGNTPSSTQVVLAAGSYSNSKGSVTYSGATYSNCVKMESATKINITPTYSGNVTLIFGGSTAAASKGVIVGGTKYTTDSNGKYTFAVTAGQTYLIEKGDAINLFIIELPSAPTAVATISAENGEVKTVKYVKNGQLIISKNGKQYTAAGAQVK